MGGQREMYEVLRLEGEEKDVPMAERCLRARGGKGGVLCLVQEGSWAAACRRRTARTTRRAQGSVRSGTRRGARAN
jgi:hypothetical protein